MSATAPRSILARLTRGVRWAWQAEAHRDALPADLDATVMEIDARERLHAKQGRSTARYVFHGPGGRTLPVYLKRHDRLPWRDRLRATLDPAGRHSPAGAEWANLARARALGVPVPEAVAAGERIGPWGRLQSYLAVAELSDADALNEVLPGLARSLPPDRFARLKRELVREMAGIAARLHRAGLFHKDLYLCHFFLDRDPARPAGSRLTLIDLHRLGEHRGLAWRWRWKDLGQLLFSTEGVEGIDRRDVARFWMHYRRQVALRFPGWQARMVRAKAARYSDHNR